MIKEKKLLNPFVGLRSFEPSEFNLFFGRKTQVKNILYNLKRTNFSAVIGYSGSGKSSLIKSGIIPALNNNPNEEWKISVCTPSINPIKELVKTLVSSYTEDESTSANLLDELEKSIIEKKENLSDILSKLNPKYSGNKLIIIDQFEEIFSLSKKEDFKNSNIFINLLLNAIKNKESNVYVILTLRSDFIGNCTEFTGLPEALNQSQYLIPRLNSKQFEEVISGPLSVVNYKISNELSNILINDINNNQDQLPILQHAMMRTVEYWKSNSSSDEVIDVHHYEAIGTMKKSLSNHADEAYDELNEHEKQVCEKMFKALVNFDSVNITRNPVEFGSLVKIIETDPSVLIKVITTFSSSKRSFLRPKAGENIKDSTVIDISHESLLRLWTRLQSWTKEEMESSETYKNLCETAKDYQEGKGSLLINPELAIILKWKEKQLPSKGWGLRYDKTFPRAINFLEDSKTKFDQEILNKSLEQTKKTKRNKRLLIFFSVLSILLLGLTFFADQETKRAAKNEKIAKAKEGEAREAEAKAIDEGRKAREAEATARDKEREAREAEATAIDEGRKAKKAEAKAKDEKLNAMKAEATARVEEEKARDAEATARVEEEKARNAKIKALIAEKEAKRLKNISDAIKMAFEAEKNLDLNKIDSAIVQSKKAHNLFVNNANLERENQIYSALNRSFFEGMSKKDNFYNNKNSIGFSTITQSNRSQEFMTLDNSKRLSFHTADDTGKINTLKKEFKNIDLALYSINGDFIVLTKKTSEGNAEILIYNERNKQLIKSFPFSGQIKSLNSFQNLNQQFISFKSNKNSFLMNLNVLKYSPFENNDDNDSFVFSENGGYFMSKKKNIALLYQVTFDQSLPKLTLIKTVENPSNISTFQFSSDENNLAIGTSNGEVLIYNTNNLQSIKISKHKNVKISDLDFVEINNQSFLISASYDNTINLINIENNNDFLTLKGHKSWVKNITVNQKNKILYSVSEDASFRYWYLDQSALENQLKK